MLKEQLQHLTPTQAHYTQNIDVLSILSDIRNTWEHMTALEKKSYISFLLKKIVVDKINKTKTPESVEIVEMEFY